MSNIYKESMQHMQFSAAFDQDAISKMTVTGNRKPLKSAVKALCGVAAAAVVAVVIVAWRQWIFDPRHSGFPVGVRTATADAASVSPQPSTGLTALETIIEQQEYGVVHLSARPAEDIQVLAQSAGISNDEAVSISCYEDEYYVYFFYPDGTVAGVMAAYLIDGDSDRENEPWVLLSEDEAVALARSALLKYCDSYTEETADRFTVETWNADADGIPHCTEWRVTFTEHTASGIVRNTVYVEIDTAGKVAVVFFGHRSNVSDDALGATEYISGETATSLALEQLKVEGYDVDLEHFTATATLNEHQGCVYWVLVFEEIKNADGGYALAWQQAYWVVLDAGTGEWVSTDVGR